MRLRSELPFAPGADPGAHLASPLHDPARDWPQTNCYVDLWIEASHARKLPPEAMLGFTATIDFEGDQFTFFKPPIEDLETLYGFVTRELSLYGDIVDHVEEQCARGRLVMIETDAFFLPDTRGVSYRAEHSKTTIGVNRIDVAARTIDYFHNEGYYRAEGEDYNGLTAFGGDFGRQALPPYAEIVKPIFPALAADDMRAAARALLARHVLRRPAANPVAAFAQRLPDLVEKISAREPEFFHKFAFNTLRQLGANFELMSSFFVWLGERDEFRQEIEACRTISSTAKSVQFLLARAIVRRKSVDLDAPIALLTETYETLFARLLPRDGAVRLAS